MKLFLADRTGLEPATSAVTGRHSNQLNYRSNSPGNLRFRDGKDRFLNFPFQNFYKKIVTPNFTNYITALSASNNIKLLI